MLSQESRLESWNCLLSNEIVDCWINEESKTPQFNNFLSLLSILNVEATDKLFEDLKAKLQEIQEVNKAQPSLEKLIYIQEHLSEWYFQVYLKEINSKFQEPRIKIRDEFKKFINAFWLDASPQSALNFSSKMEGFLISQSNKYLAEKETLLQQENGGKKSYSVLTHKVIQELDNEGIKNNYNSANKALLHIFKCKIKSEICNFKIQIISAIIQDNQLIIQNLLESTSFLNQLKESFSSSSQNNSLLLSMLFEQMCSVKSPHQLRQEIENHLGIPLNRWGSCGYISLEEVKKFLIAKISVITKDIYGQLIQELSSEVKLNKEENKDLELLAISN